jgi:hypothetical protein
LFESMQSTMHCGFVTSLRGQSAFQHCQAPLSCGRSRHAPSSQRCMQASRAALDEFSQPRKPRRDLAGPAHVFAPATESRDATSSASGSDLELEERTTDGQSSFSWSAEPRCG